MRDSNCGYQDQAALRYDLQTVEHDRDDAAFYRERAKSVDCPLLELACGSGRVYL